MKSVPNILKKKTTYVFDYPQAIEFAQTQSSIFWLADEVVIDKDLLDLKTNLTDPELHGVITVLKLFTEYELRVGKDFWLGKMMNMFHRPELHRMFAVFGQMELNVHAPFYNKINELLGLSTDEFYSSYVDDPVLKSRMDEIERVLSLPAKTVLEKLLVVACFSIVEGAILYSNFAFLKHFSAEGKNKLSNLVSGINFSLKDEQLHSIAGAWLFRTLLEEAQLSNEELEWLFNEIHKFARTTQEHEHKIVEMIFEKGRIVGITEHQMKVFIDGRVNLCLEQLSAPTIEEFKHEHDVISKWFYRGIQQGELHDFFVNQSSFYNRDWRETEFKW